MAVWPILLAGLGTIEAVTGAVVFMEFIKEEAIQNVMMAASQAVRYNQLYKAKELYQKVRDVYVFELARTVGKVDDFDSELTHWANWTPWGVWDTILLYNPATPWTWPQALSLPLADNNGWGTLAPYSQPAFIAFVNSTLLSCKTHLEML